MVLLGWCAIVCVFGWKAWRPLLAPTERKLAYVLQRSTEARHVGGSRTSRTVLDQRVTLELEDGRRVSLGGSDAIVGTVVEGDLGVAFTKADQLIGFRRLAS